MHILIIPSEHFVTQRYPLGGIFQLHQANALHAAGYQVGVLALGVITPRYLFRTYSYPDVDYAGGYPVFRHYTRRFFPQRWVRPNKSIRFYQKYGQELYSAYKKQFGKPDVVHVHNIQFAGFVAQKIKQLDNVPYIITEHNGNFRTNSVSSEWVSPLRDVVGAGSAMTAVSRALATSIEAHLGIIGIDVLPNLVDSAFVDSVLVPRRITPLDFIFLNIASLDANKNQGAIIEAFATHFKGKSFKLRIAGDGPLKRYLQGEAERMGVSEQVVFLGYLDRQAVMKEMQSADCFVLASQQETFGVVLIESLACGTPIIATRCGGPDEIVHEQNGLLVPPSDAGALGAAMVTMSNSKGLYLPEVLRDDCRKRFGAGSFVGRLGYFYANAVARGQEGEF